MRPFLQTIVAAAFGLHPDVLGEPGRGRADVAFARQVAMYLAYTRFGLSYVGAGRLFDRDRTTARHGCRQVEESRDDPRIDAIVAYLERALDSCPLVIPMVAEVRHRG
ncbi:helix-turn-helix domain-containing protein [Bauldia sp.]|uniref:helix-turn-helix domain-containing protein n=1 Tax=Bauldia sp. TaxID=2575872 RepID=UPI003BAB294E